MFESISIAGLLLFFAWRALAFATPPSRFTRTEVSTGVLGEVDVRGENDDKWEVRFETKDDSTLGLDRLYIVNGELSDWLKHAGITIVTVTAGEVRWFDGANPDCPAKIYRVGDSFVEPANNVNLCKAPPLARRCSLRSRSGRRVPRGALTPRSLRASPQSEPCQAVIHGRHLPR